MLHSPFTTQLPLTPHEHAGSWRDHTYRGPNNGRKVYGDGRSARLCGQLLKFRDLVTVEDWGCGCGGMERFLAPWQLYIGVDGSWSPYVDIAADLTTYVSCADAVILRHVLEHNLRWPEVLKNAVASCRNRLVIITFAPLSERSVVIRESGDVASLGQTMHDIILNVSHLVCGLRGARWTLYPAMESCKGDGLEHVLELVK